MDDAAEDDLRHQELETLEAIFPEIRRLAGHHDPPASGTALVFELELPVKPMEPVTVVFPTAPTQQLHGSPAVQPAEHEAVDSLRVCHLPPVVLTFTLPNGYPQHQPPQMSLSTTPQWLSPSTLRHLENDSPGLWEEAGRDLVVYTFIDTVQRAADQVFGTVTDGKLQVPPEHKLAILDYDIKAKRAAFEEKTFHCGICIEPKRGSSCHEMLDCGHVFCLECLGAFYNDAIAQGNLSTVRCLQPNCARDRGAVMAKSTSSRPRKPKLYVTPSELLQIGLSEETVKRYIALKYKTQLESDKNTVYCPRSWCNGAARSDRRKKPQGLELAEPSDEEDEAPGPQQNADHANAPKFESSELLAICEDCSFAFCRRCLQTWHGKFVRCVSKRDKGELSAEEKASLEYLKLHTSPCPTCDAPAQKTQGCNHMICSRCETHFCYLCCAWLDPTNPYRHYNTLADGSTTSCYMRLWELEGGDGDDVGQGFAGRQRHVEHVDDDEVDAGFVRQHQGVLVQPGRPGNGQQARARAAQPANRAGGRVAIEREAPLVLRVRQDAAQQDAQQGEEEGDDDDDALAHLAHIIGLMDGDHELGLGEGQAQMGMEQRAGQGNRRRAAPANERTAAQNADRRRRGQGNERRAAAQDAGRRTARGRPRPAEPAAQARGAARAPRGQAQPGAREAAPAPVERRPARLDAAPGDGQARGDYLNMAQRDWVQAFVRLALVDAEDELEPDDLDSDDENWLIPDNSDSDDE
ncbi:hypothetical protein CDD82_4955 [Ophiocordyceps australis]|uniref:RBR-type E3 ubiquitin transferase n=1 Tax=Ophiocordyceps australis TaxID=1399860 RepID=A0A2C5Z5E3_9HYPO|nr:hypothetical protein CDD82_4955 [Ophiocordyceps australis]